MSQSLSQIYLHIIFHVKTTSPKIKDEHLDRVHSYIGQLVNATGSRALRVGGVEDHVHVVCTLSRDGMVSHLVEEVKRNSSRWIKSLDAHYTQFAWQGGYAAYSISQSVLDMAIKYVDNQREHHKKLSYRDEYIQFLKLYKVEYDEKYIFSD